MHAKERIFLIIALLYILYTIFPLFADMFQIPVWLPSIAAFIVMLILYPKAFFNKTFFWFLVYALVLVIYLLLGRRLTIGIGTVADKKKIIIEFAYILPTISMFCILYYLKDELLIRKLVRWSIVMLFVSFIIAIPLMLRYSSIRAALGEEQAGEIIAIGLPGYSLMHAYSLFLPVLCYGTKGFNGVKKLWLLIGLSLLVFVIYDTFVTTSLLITIAILLFTALYSEKNRSVFWIVTAILLIVFFVLYKRGVFITLIDRIMPAFEGTAVEFKLNDFKDSMLQGRLTGSSITGRQTLHDISWTSFFHNPIFGTSMVGGHSSLMDRFGGMGVVAGLPFLMIFVSFIQQMIKLYHTRMARAYFWVGIAAGFVYLYQKGMWGCESWLVYMVLMPFGILTIEKQIENHGTTTS